MIEENKFPIKDSIQEYIINEVWSPVLNLCDFYTLRNTDYH